MIRKLKVIVYFRKVFRPSAKKFMQIVLLFSFKFSHFLNLRACKNDNFLFIMGTSSLEARNIRFVNSNLSRVQESKLFPAS
jgi:hypothetical protein